MSNPETFIDEVTEEVRRDKLFALFRKWGWVAGLLVILIVGGAAANEWLKARDAAAAQATGDAILAAMETEDPQLRAAALQDVAAEGDARVVLDLIRAVEVQDAATADTILADISDNAGYPALYRDLAIMKRVTLADSPMSPAEKVAALEPLTTPGSPFRTLAEEQVALAELAKGDVAAALDRLQALLVDAEATAGLRDRASQLIVALGGEPVQSLDELTTQVNE